MNISSVVIYLDEGVDEASLRAALEHIEGCEPVACEKDRAVATIQSDSIDGQIAAFREIEQVCGVREVAMVYSYGELGEQIAAASSNDIESIVRDIDEKDTKDIRYGGSVKI